VKGATEFVPGDRVEIEQFQSTLPVKGATAAWASGEQKKAISIHAPCEGSDLLCFIGFIPCFISIHAPCEGSDLYRRITIV